MMNNKPDILIVEDDVLIGIAMEMQLKKNGYSILKRVTTGEEAIQSAKSEKVDVFIMDIGLAGNIDGIEAAENIREFSNASIIYATGYKDNKTKERALKTNPMAYLIKPVDIRILLDYLSKIY